MSVQTINEAVGTLERTKTPGRMLITIITAGQGSSGTYPAETIQDAVERKLWAKGTLMYGNHQTPSEAAERPEGDIWNAIGKLAEDAYWNEEIQGAQAVAEIYPSVKDVVFERAQDMGISIRGGGRIDEAGTVTELTSIESVDLVTKAGRGGSVVELLESARRDLVERNGGEYRPRHALDANRTATGHPRPEPDSRSLTPVGESHSTATAGGTMVDIQESELNQLRASAEQAEQLKTQLAEAEQARAEAEDKLAEAQRRTQAEAIVAAAFEGVNAPKLRARLVEAAVRADEFDADAFKAEAEEVAAELTENAPGPRVEGFGDTTPINEAQDVNEDTILATLKEGRV